MVALFGQWRVPDVFAFTGDDAVGLILRLVRDTGGVQPGVVEALEKMLWGGSPRSRLYTLNSLSAEAFIKQSFSVGLLGDA